MHDLVPWRIYLQIRVYNIVDIFLSTIPARGFRNDRHQEVFERGLSQTKWDIGRSEHMLTYLQSKFVSLQGEIAELNSLPSCPFSAIIEKVLSVSG